MMNKIERLDAVLSGETPDRVPVSFWFHFAKDKIAGEAMAEAHLEYYRACDPDFLKVMNDNRYDMPDDMPVIEKAEDWARLPKNPASAANYQKEISGLKALAEELGGEAYFITTVFDPMATGNYISNRKVIDHLRENPEATMKGLSAIAESLADFAAACIEEGSAGIYYSAQAGGSTKLTQEEHLRYMRPLEMMIWDAAASKGNFNLLHLCGPGMYFENYRHYPFDVVNWAVGEPGNFSVPEGKEFFQKPVCGGLDNNGVIVTGPADDIQKAVRKAMNEGGRTNFILGANCTVPNDISWDNLVAAIDAARS
jgi:uroporphyrinogen decarboxylase